MPSSPMILIPTKSTPSDELVDKLYTSQFTTDTPLVDSSGVSAKIPVHPAVEVKVCTTQSSTIPCVSLRYIPLSVPFFAMTFLIIAFSQLFTSSPYLVQSSMTMFSTNISDACSKRMAFLLLVSVLVILKFFNCSWSPK